MSVGCMERAMMRKEMSKKIEAPWTKQQVEGLQRYQENDFYHEYTCGGEDCGSTLVPTINGWVCQFCNYKQDWAHAWSSVPEDMRK